MNINNSPNNIIKPKGLENARLQHAKHPNYKKEYNNPSPNASPAASLELSIKEQSSQAQVNNVQSTANLPSTAVPSNASTIEKGAEVNTESQTNVDNSNDILTVEHGAKVDVKSQVNVDNGHDTLIVESGAKVKIDSQVGADNSHDTMIVDHGAKVDIKSKADVDNSEVTTYVGSGAKLKMDIEIGTDNSKGTVIIDEGADVEITGKIGVSSFEGITHLKGKIRINLSDDTGNRFAYDISIKDEKERQKLTDFLQEKLKGHKSLAELQKDLLDFKKHVKHHNAEHLGIPESKDKKQEIVFDKHEALASLQQSLADTFFKKQVVDTYKYNNEKHQYSKLHLKFDEHI